MLMRAAMFGCCLARVCWRCMSVHHRAMVLSIVTDPEGSSVTKRRCELVLGTAGWAHGCRDALQGNQAY